MLLKKLYKFFFKTYDEYIEERLQRYSKRSRSRYRVVEIVFPDGPTFWRLEEQYHYNQWTTHTTSTFKSEVYHKLFERLNSADKKEIIHEI